MSPGKINGLIHRCNGGRKGRGPEPLLFQVCLDLESADDDHLVAGLSFDLVKAFDRIPRELLGRILSKMSMPANVLKPYLGMLRSATRRYKIGVSLDKPRQIFGGILQGCPLSMIALNAVVNVWLQMLNERVPQSRPRAYADDFRPLCVGHPHNRSYSTPEMFSVTLTSSYPTLVVLSTWASVFHLVTTVSLVKFTTTFSIAILSA